MGASTLTASLPSSNFNKSEIKLEFLLLPSQEANQLYYSNYNKQHFLLEKFKCLQLKAVKLWIAK